MPTFEPFRAARFPADALASVTAPPYDVLSESDLDELEARDQHNIVHVDVPRARDGESRYDDAGRRWRDWVAAGVVDIDEEPSFTLYRMTFVDAAGRDREIVGVIGALEVVDEGAGHVLPHERVTPKASTDRLDLTEATDANLSPVWGLSLAEGLTSLLLEPGEPMGTVTADGVTHTVERVTDEARVAAIAAMVWSDDVLVADGHHRYGVARRFRDDVRARTGRSDTAAETTMTFVSELVADQLSVEAIHRVYRSIDPASLRAALSAGFEIEPADAVSDGTLSTMDERGLLCLVEPDAVSWLVPKPGAFDGVRSLDGAWLEHLLAGVDHEVSYQHGVDEVLGLVHDDPTVSAAVLIRPVSVGEIERTAREGLLMPPKSTFFTPKLLTGLAMRPLDTYS